jgi:hypothetical protein
MYGLIIINGKKMKGMEQTATAYFKVLFLNPQAKIEGTGSPKRKSR